MTSKAYKTRLCLWGSGAGVRVRLRTPIQGGKCGQNGYEQTCSGDEYGVYSVIASRVGVMRRHFIGGHVVAARRSNLTWLAADGCVAR